MTAKIREHYFTFYVNYYNKDCELIKTEHFNTIDEAIASAHHWGAYIVK